MSVPVLIEGLESRTLFAVTVPAHLNTAAVQSAGVDVQIAEASLTDARDFLTSAVEVNRTLLQNAQIEGKESVLAAKDALKTARREQPDRVAEFEQALADAEAEFKANVASAKQVLKEDTASGKAQLKSATAGLKDARKALKSAVKQATVEQKAVIKEIQSDLDAILADPDVTAEQQQALAADLAAAAKGATPPTQATIDQLAENFSLALDDGELSSRDQAQLATDIVGVLNSTNLEPDAVIPIVEDARALFARAGVEGTIVEGLAGNLLAVYSELNPDVS